MHNLKILIIGATCSYNKGAEAILLGAVRALKMSMPDSYFTISSIYPEADRQNCARYGFTVVPKTRLKFVAQTLRLTALLFLEKVGKKNSTVGRRLCPEYDEADAVIDLHGDYFSDDYGLLATLDICVTIMLCKKLQKPYVIYGQSIGPFKTNLTKELSRICLDAVDLLLVREEITRDYLQELGVTNRIYLTAEPAFLLNPAPENVVTDILQKEGITPKQGPLIGLNLGAHIIHPHGKKGKRMKYPAVAKTPYGSSREIPKEVFVRFIEHLVEDLGAQIMFVPHAISEYSWADDRTAARQIYDAVKNKERLCMVTGDYSAEELKGIIGQCDAFVGVRFHSVIAAASQGVPSIAIAYSHKALGIMRMLEMAEYVVSLQELTYDALASTMMKLWGDRTRIRTELLANSEILKSAALHNAELVESITKLS